MTRIEVLLKDGKRCSIEKDASNILLSTWDNIEAKFRKLAAESLMGKRATEIVDLVKHMDRVDDIHRLTHQLRDTDRKKI